jgi:glycosyltransferase involved in cell wall biosynthesis
MKICVYAIAKNEAAFVDRFCDAAAEADYIAVLDTGSDDGTPEALEKRGCIVGREIIDPWRFDVARNRSMELIPADTDVCVCVDLDEILLPGWRAALERAWTDKTESGRFMNIRSRNADGTPGTAFYHTKLHRPGVMRWKYPVHEVLVRADGRPDGPDVTVADMAVEHLPDVTKSRGQYLPLLELAAQENPTDARSAHYLGREYMFYGRWDDAIHELLRHLALPTAKWREERAASKRYLSRCYAGKGDKQEAMRWAMNAVCEQPELREDWYEAEQAAYALEDWSGVLYFGQHAAAITKRSDVCINEEEAWGAGVYDLLSLACWHFGDIGKARDYGELAAKLAPADERIKKNLEYYRKAAMI